MNHDNDRILAFLAARGIEAEIYISDDQEKLLAIKKEHYQQHRDWIDRWFTLVDQRGDYCYFRERLRGTGQTL